jgi:hypothetical protein
LTNGEMLAKALHGAGWRMHDDGTLTDEEGEDLGPLTMDLVLDVAGFLLELPAETFPGLPRARA